jgi:hypothetical protein
MHLSRVCKTCGKPFFADKLKSFSCCRKCFKREYYQRMKLVRKIYNDSPRFPFKYCNCCGKKSQLTFDPIKHPQLFNLWVCPFCGVVNEKNWKFK